MVSCTTLKRYEGTKSQIILQQINNVIKTNKEKRLPELSKDTVLLEKLKEFKAAEDALKSAKKSFEDICVKLGVRYETYTSYRHDEDDYGKQKSHFVIMSECFVPAAVEKKLQAASDLQAIGKKKEANEIWDSLINQYGLGKL